MSMYAISYDLEAPKKNYDEVTKTIEACGNAWHCLGSTWLVVSKLDCDEIRDKIKATMDEGDRLLVVELTGFGAWKGFDARCKKWLMDNL